MNAKNTERNCIEEKEFTLPQSITSESMYSLQTVEKSGQHHQVSKFYITSNRTK